VTTRRGRPPDVPAPVVVAIRAALAAGDSPGAIGRRFGVSRRYVRDLQIDGPDRRPDGVDVPPEIAALDGVTGELAPEAAMIRELWGLLAFLGR